MHMIIKKEHNTEITKVKNSKITLDIVLYYPSEANMKKMK